MSLQIKYDENFSAGLKRLLHQQVQVAQQALKNAGSEEQRHEAVHDVRKVFKKIRAYLRLVRDEVDYYQQENKFFRNLGREISEIRDSKALLETLHLLKTQYQDQLYNNSFAGLEKDLTHYRDGLAEQRFEKDKVLEKLSSALEEPGRRIPYWPLSVGKFKEVQPALERVYGRGKDKMKDCRKAGGPADFHEWRKRIKYLRYQLEALARIWPGMMESMERELHDLSDFIGMSHDLHILQETVRKRNSPFANANEETLFHTLVEKQQDLMQQHALLKGVKFYCESPSEFSKRLGVFWKSHAQKIKQDLPEVEKLEY